MGLHVAGQLGRGLAVHAAQLAQDAVSPRGLEPMVLHRVDAQVCCCGEAYGGVGMGGWGQPGGDPRDRAVLLGGGHPPHMALSSSHILGRLGPTTPEEHSLSLSLGTGLNGARF